MRVIELQEQTLIFLRKFAAINGCKDFDKDLTARTIPSGWPTGIVELLIEFYAIQEQLLDCTISPFLEIRGGGQSPTIADEGHNTKRIT